MNFLSHFFRKLIFKKNQKSSVIFFDNNYANLKLKNIKFSIFNNKEINIRVLIKAIVERIQLKYLNLSFKELYIRNYCISHNAKIAIGHNFNPYMFKFKKICPNVISIIYLHNRLYIDQINFIKKNYMNSEVDYFLVCDELHKKKLSKFIKSEFIVTGLLRNNEIVLKKEKKKYDIMFISEYRNLPEEHYYTKCHNYVIKTISNFCKKNNKKLCIAMNSSRIEKMKKLKFNNEITYFRNLINDFNYEKVNSYKLANKSKMSVCIASNLGAELLSRKFKVFFLPLLQRYDKIYSSMYLLKQNNFSYFGYNKKKIFEKLNYLLNLEEKKWQSSLKKSKINFMFDKNNKIVKRLIYKIIK